jgi:hypothetical protein
MAKMTLLEMTQDILSDMDSDEVNSINDSVESLQVAQIIKTTYYNIIDGRDYDFLYELFQLESSGTSSRPTHMKLPENIIDLKYIKYNTRKSADTKDKYLKIDYLNPEDFMEVLDARDSSKSNVTVVTDTTGISLNIKNDKAPEYFTSFDDENLVFDSYDSVIDSTLQNSKTQCHGKRSVAFTLLDTFTPDLPVQMFSYLLAEAKSTAFVTLKQMPNAKAEQVSNSQKRRMSQDAWRLKNGIEYPNYGRSVRVKKGPNY